MKTLDPSQFVTMTIEEADTTRFEAFLDRNYRGWREREFHKAKNAGTIRRQWYVGVDDIERNALFRKEYVEVRDQFIDLDAKDEARIHGPKNIICDIDGDLTPAAKWGNRPAHG